MSNLHKLLTTRYILTGRFAVNINEYIANKLLEIMFKMRKVSSLIRDLYLYSGELKCDTDTFDDIINDKIFLSCILRSEIKINRYKYIENGTYCYIIDTKYNQESLYYNISQKILVKILLHVLSFIIEYIYIHENM